MLNHIAAQIEATVPDLPRFKIRRPKNSTLPELSRFVRRSSKMTQEQSAIKVQTSCNFRPSRRRSRLHPTFPRIERPDPICSGRDELIVGLKALLDYYKKEGIDTKPFRQLELASDKGWWEFFKPLEEKAESDLDWQLSDGLRGTSSLTFMLNYFELGDEFGSHVEQCFTNDYASVACLFEEVVREEHYYEGFDEELCISDGDLALIDEVGGFEPLLAHYAKRSNNPKRWYDFERLGNPLSFFSKLKKYRDFDLKHLYLFRDSPHYVTVEGISDIRFFVDYQCCFADLRDSMPDSWRFMENHNNEIGNNVRHFCEIWREDKGVK